MKRIIFFFLLFSKLCLSQEVPGVVIDHAFAEDSLYIGSPSICILPNGNYIATHEYFSAKDLNKSSNTVVFLSTDKGNSWKHISTIQGQIWAKVFTIDSTLYIIGPVSSGEDLVIRKSTDKGYHWTNPIDKYSGRIFNGRYHTAPTSIVFFNNRIWKAVEDMDGPSDEWGIKFRAMMVSAPLNSNLLQASNWTKTNAMPYKKEYLNGHFGGWLEGNAVVGPDKKVYDILRTDYRESDGEKAAIISVSDDGKKVSFNAHNDFINFPGGCKKFNILYDSISNLYWSLSNYVPDSDKGFNVERTRNTLALIYSKDLRNWTIKGIILHHQDVLKHAFQYVDFQFEGDDMIFVSRTAFDDHKGGANSQHNANYFTFHRIKNFRNYITPDMWGELMP